MKVCIICEKEAPAGSRAVEDDFAISAIRRAKQALRIAKNNELYVCPACMDAYVKKRKKFETNLAIGVAAAVLIFVALNGAQLLFGSFSAIGFISATLLSLLIVVLVVVNYHMPPLVGGAPVAAPAEVKTAPAQPAETKPAVADRPARKPARRAAGE
jgi:hypothetical protein